MVQFEIQIIERDDESGISELARYSEVNSMIGKEINAILLELWNAGEVAAWFETIEDEDEDMDSEEESSITPLQATKLGPLPDSLIGFEVEYVGYGDGVIKSIDSRSFQIEVKFEDHEEPKTFVFPGCFLSGKLTLKNDEDQLGLEEHLKKYKQMKK